MDGWVELRSTFRSRRRRAGAWLLLWRRFFAVETSGLRPWYSLLSGRRGWAGMARAGPSSGRAATRHDCPHLPRPAGRRPTTLRYAPVRQRPPTTPGFPSSACGACRRPCPAPYPPTRGCIVVNWNNALSKRSAYVVATRIATSCTVIVEHTHRAPLHWDVGSHSYSGPCAWAPDRRFAGAARLCGIEDARTRCSSGTFSDSRWLSDPRVRGRLDSVQSSGKSWLAMTACA